MKRAVRGVSAVIVWISVLLFCMPPCAAQAADTVWEEESVVEETFLFPADGEENPAEGYIRQKLYPQRTNGPRKAPRLIGSRLEGVDQIIYSGLYAGIVEAAAGLRESTVFRFPFEDLYETRTFTAQELGIESILVNGAVSQAAKEAAKSMMAVPDYTAINQALLADCPYELYWFNKVDGGMKISTGRRYSADADAITVDGTITVSMTVSWDYAAGDYLVDPSYGQSVFAAADAAREIVERYGDWADAEKLLAYKNEICDLAAYYDQTESEGLPYGNPWQLIWVFDGDPDTCVTCEGYAKAFQYLCDLSSDGISVISVSGEMNGSNHMWNIARMEDGRNYLIDVTNCDSGMAGYPNILFLAGAEEGNAKTGYTFSAGPHQLTYQYGAETPFSASELKIAYWSYAAGGPPAPVFQAVAGAIYENERMLFSYLDDGYPYDELTAEITFVPPESEETQLFEQTVYMPEDASWAYEPLSLDPGDYFFRFAGSRDGGSSAWTEPVLVRVAGIEELVPTYRFSTRLGYTGFQAVIRLDQHAQGICVLETGQEYPCQEQDALIPLNEPGENTFTVALVWNGKVSAWGEAMTVAVRDLPELPALTVPADTQAIEREAFRGVCAGRLTIPETVESIGEYAFADIESLLLVEIGAPDMEETAFENCPNAVFLPSRIDWGFDRGVPFVQ